MRERLKRLPSTVGSMQYPEATLQLLAEVLESDWRVPLSQVLEQASKRLRSDAKPPSARRRAAPHCGAEPPPPRINLSNPEHWSRLVLTPIWERATRSAVPPGHLLVLIDGDESNLLVDNIYCIPRHELVSWMRVFRTPLEARVARLQEQVMALKTSDDVKNKLLHVLDDLVDPTTPPDYLRQRAICETVQALVGLLKVEVAYVRAIDGDGIVPFLEPARDEARKRREDAGRRSPALSGPATNHPWRGLGGRS